MERIVQCLSPVHIGTGKQLEPFDYIVDGQRYIRVHLDAVLEQMTPEQADRLAAWVSEQADQLVGLEQQRDQGGDRTRLNERISELRRNMQLSNFRGGDASFQEAIRTDATLARYQADRGFERNLQVREQVKSADDTPLIPGSSLKGALRTALAFAALEEMEPDDRQALGQSLERTVRQAEEAKQRRYNRDLNRLKERIGQEIEQAVFRCGKEQRGRISYRDIQYDLLRGVSVSDTYDAQTELIVPQIYTFVEQRTLQGNTRLVPQAPLIAEAHAPGNTFRLRLQVDGGLLQAIRRNRRRGEWIDFEQRVQRAFGPEVARLLSDASDEQIGLAVVNRLEEAARRFARAIVEAEQHWEESHGYGTTHDIKGFYNRLDDLIGKGQVPLRLGWGSHFMANTLLLVLKEDAGWRPILERCFRAFDIGVPPRRHRGRGRESERHIDLDDFPRSRRLIAAGRRPIAPLGWIALVPTMEALPGPLVEKERLIAQTQRGDPRQGGRPQVGGPGRGGRRGAGSSPRSERPPPPIKIPKPTPKPSPRKGPQPGDRVNVEIVANDNAQVTVKVLDGQGEEVKFRQPYYPGQPGEKRKMKVRAVDAQGRITQVAP